MKIKRLFLSGLIAIMIPSGVFGENLRLSILPRYSPQENIKIMNLLAKYLSKKTGKTIEPLITSDYSEFEKRILSGDIDMAIENPTVYTKISGVHEALASAVDNLGGEQVRGLIISGKDSPVKKTDDLKGKKICIVSKTASAGYLSPKLKLAETGLNIEKDCTLVESVENKQENIIFSIMAGDADAGFIREAAFHKADEYIKPGSLTIIGEGSWLPNDAFSVRKTLAPDIRISVSEALKNLEKSDEIMTGLGITSWIPARDSVYDPVRKALEN